MPRIDDATWIKFAAACAREDTCWSPRSVSIGPEKCSGLQVARYAPEELHAQFGRQFRLIRSVPEDHITPTGAIQRFVYCLCSMENPEQVERVAS